MANEPTPAPTNTEEYVRGFERKAKARARLVALALFVAVGGSGVAAYFVFTRPVPARSGISAAPPTTVESTPNVAAQPVVTPERAQEAFKKAPKDLAALAKGPLGAQVAPRPAPAPADASNTDDASSEAADDEISGAFEVPSTDAYELARQLAADRRGAVQLCYERELKRNPNLRGHVTVDLQLKAPHEVGEIRVVDNLRRESFTECVRAAMERVEFPPLREDLIFEIPFALKSVDL